ncbi:SusC/RagA family TonB-linked outer membrane protein [Pedobacter jeongneungensis]|uniref:SusC/RagA family TonB-linked outer membrane protein n=1 Tax=Pedobacter jeongneungensis TaxID=947309 RepID=UPI0004688E00|nr:TonB-dependent receptor [Pedobacter jeongneungensis]
MSKTLRAAFLLVSCMGFFLSSLAQNTSKVVTGTVYDEKGETLPGVGIQVKGTTLTTSTNIEGKYSINLPSGSNILVFRFVGLATQEITIGSKMQVSVTLKSVNTNLSDVVVIGYGTVKRKDLTGAVSRVTREELTKDAPANVLQAMQGKVAGVNVTQNDGAPGAALSIRVRGSNSFLGGTEPLYVIDGIPFNSSSSSSTPKAIGGDEKQTLNAMSFINPNDIESIDVLKDASATAIYGSRGANGVVLITTRKGSVGKDKVEFNLTSGLAQVSNLYKMLNASDYATYQNLSYTNANKYGIANYTPDQFPFPGMTVTGPTGQFYKPGPQDYASNSKDWQQEIFRTGLSQNYSVNISGGSESGNHSIGFNYLDQNGTIENSDYKRFGVNLNLNRNLGKFVKVGTSLSVARSVTNGVKTGTDKSDDANAGVVRSAITYPTTIFDNQSFGDAKSAGSQGYFITNPGIYVNDVLNRVKGINIFSSNYAEFTFLKDFKFRQNLGFNFSSNTRDQYYPRTVYEGFTVNGDGLKADDQWNSVVSESLLSYYKKLEKHEISVVAGSTYELTNSQWKKQEARDFTSDLLQNENLGSGATQVTPQGDKSQSTLISFLGRANYSYDNRYFLTASLRRDGSSKFGANNKWANFPSAAIAWKLINEGFLKDKIKSLSELKLRLSYGQTGNQGIGSYSSLSKLTVYKYPLNGALQTGYADDYFSGPANPDLKWETTDAYNLGLDLGMFQNRLNLTVDAYLKKTNDLLQYVTTPLSSGFPRKLVNAGSVQNKGIEFTLSGSPVKSENFEWNSSFNIAFNRNKITSLGSEVQRQFAGNISTGDSPFIQIVGQSIGTIYGWVEDGYYDNEAEVRNDPQFTNANAALIKKMIGEIKYRNLDNDPSSITDNDRTFIGNVNPKFTFGFTNNFRYKNFDLSIFINGSYGNDIINMNTRFIGLPGDFKNITYAMYEGAWREGQDNNNATSPKIIRDFSRQTVRFTSRFIEDGSFARLKNVTIGYNFKTKVLGLNGLRVAVGANNLYTLTRYSGYDPEVNSYGDNPALYGVDLGGYPNSRTFNFTLRCNF